MGKGQKKNRKPATITAFRRPCQGIDATGFEPATSASRTQRSTKLSHASISYKILHYELKYYTSFFKFCK